MPTLDLTALPGPTTVTLTSSGPAGFGGTATGYGTFTGVDAILAPPVAGNVLRGRSVASVWTFDGTPTAAYAVGADTLAFTGFDRVEGGAAADTFRFLNDARPALTVVGGVGGDKLDFTDPSNVNPVSISLTGTNAGVVDGVTAFGSVESVAAITPHALARNGFQLSGTTAGF